MSLATSGAEAPEQEQAAADAGPASELAAAGHHLLEMFAAVCGAPDDEETAAKADAAMAAVASLLASQHDLP